MRHEAHRSSSTWAVTADKVNCGWDRNVVALEAAANACEIDSGNNLGLWAVPHTKIPSVAMSTGLSWTWASIK